MDEIVEQVPVVLHLRNQVRGGDVQEIAGRNDSRNVMSKSAER
jgi:hypothetical protein